MLCWTATNDERDSAQVTKGMISHLTRCVAVIAVLGACMACICSARKPQQIGAVLKSVQLDRKYNCARVEIANISSKDIRAVNVSIEVRFADGTKEKSEELNDFLPTILQRKEKWGAVSNLPVIHPHETYPEDVEVRSGKRISAVAASLDMVEYADRTADVANERALSRLLSTRGARAAAKREAAEILANASSSHKSIPPRLDAIRNLIAVIRDSNSTTPKEFANEVLLAIDDLEDNRSFGYSDAQEREFLEVYGRRKARSAKVMSLDTNVERRNVRASLRIGS